MNIFFHSSHSRGMASLTSASMTRILCFYLVKPEDAISHHPRLRWYQASSPWLLTKHVIMGLQPIPTPIVVSVFYSLLDGSILLSCHLPATYYWKTVVSNMYNCITYGCNERPTGGLIRKPTNRPNFWGFRRNVQKLSLFVGSRTSLLASLDVNLPCTFCPFSSHQLWLQSPTHVEAMYVTPACNNQGSTSV